MNRAVGIMGFLRLECGDIARDSYRQNAALQVLPDRGLLVARATGPSKRATSPLEEVQSALHELQARECCTSAAGRVAGRSGLVARATGSSGVNGWNRVDVLRAGTARALDPRTPRA